MITIDPEEGSLEIEVQFVLDNFIKSYFSCTDEQRFVDHHVYKKTNQGVKSVDIGPGEGKPENSFRGSVKGSKRDLYWKIETSGSCCVRTNSLMRILADLSDKNVTLLHNGVKVVNIYKVRHYIPLKGLERDFILDYTMQTGDVPNSKQRLYPVLSQYLEQFPNLPDKECDKVVKVAQTEAIAKARGVGTDDLALHYWCVLTLENATMLHIDTTGPMYDCFEYEEGSGYPLTLRETPELLLEEPHGALKDVYPDTVVLTNKCLDGTKAELPEWRVFDCFDEFPAEVLFLEGFGKYSNFQHPHIQLINLVVCVTMGMKIRHYPEDVDVELYNLRSGRFNGEQGTVESGSNPLDYTDRESGTYNPRLPFTFPSGKTILVKPENIMLLPKMPSQYLTWRQVERKMGWKHKMCNCVHWKKGLGTRKGLFYPVFQCDPDCDHDNDPSPHHGLERSDGPFASDNDAQLKKLTKDTKTDEENIDAMYESLF